ncbi:dyslexia-associated protein KIAA0319 isoform X1 [Osmerus mordax]|uniref:dyslexia-associated protein KIAA0319 isoform X1 n=1 Tax=Osmerus mordax TaxID=8014 RepID=UPI00350F4120
MWRRTTLHLYLFLQCLEGVVATQCWKGETFSEAVVSPALRSSSILRVPNVDTLAQCVGACCDLPGCDLAWLFEQRCYILSCQKWANCQPRQRPGADSHLTFLQRGEPQTLVLKSLVRGEPYRSRWRLPTRPSGDVEALKDLALFDEASRSFGDPGMMALEYSDGELSPEDNGAEPDVTGDAGAEEVFPDWPAELKERDGFNQSEIENGPGGWPAESSMPKYSHSTEATVNHAPPPSDRSPTFSPTPAERNSDLQNAPLNNSESPALMPSSQNSTQHSQTRPSEATPLISITTPFSLPTQPVKALLVSLGDPVEVLFPIDTVELVASVSPEPEIGSFFRYNWVLVHSTDGHKEVIDGEHSRAVRLRNMSVGHYVVSVVVSGEGVYGECEVNMTVNQAVTLSQPPTAIVVPTTQTVSLLARDTIINGSKSRDDGGIVIYHWDQVAGAPVELGPSLDSQILSLPTLMPGEYMFNLTVTDSDSLSDSATASVKVVQPERDDLSFPHVPPAVTTRIPGPALSSTLKEGDPTPARSPDLPPGTTTVKPETGDVPVAEVKPESNLAPKALVGPDRQLTLPVTSIMLDGSGSTDDHGIVSYHWDTISGPPGLKIERVDKAIATATGLRAGRYTFRLIVSDQEGARDSASLTIRIQEARNFPPVAHASGSHTLTMPNNSLVLRGSVTNGNPAEVRFLWVRDSQSPAAGDVLYGSVNQASLYLANLVEGTYLFQLRVTDSQGRTSTATATVEVRPDPGGSEEVEVEMLVAVAQVSVAQKDTVLRQLAALLHVLDTDIHLRGLRGHSDLSTVLRFSVQGPEGPVPGTKLASLLRTQLLREKTDYLLFRVLRVDTVLCLLRCSGHGQCDPVTKECVCDPFWTENLIRLFLGDGESNCEWRVLYVVISCFMVVVFIMSFTWAFICCCKRRRRTKIRKKTKYTILDNMDEQERMELRPKYNIKHRSTEHNSSLMMSESELDSDQDTIFSRDRPVRSRNRASVQASRNGNAFG